MAKAKQIRELKELRDKLYSKHFHADQCSSCLKEKSKSSWYFVIARIDKESRPAREAFIVPFTELRHVATSKAYVARDLKALKTPTFSAKWKLNMETFMAVPGAQPDVLEDEERGLTWKDKEVLSVYCSFQSRCRHGLEVDAINGKLFPPQSIVVVAPETSTAPETDNRDVGDSDEEDVFAEEEINRLFGKGDRRKRGRPPGKQSDNSQPKEVNTLLLASATAAKRALEKNARPNPKPQEPSGSHSPPTKRVRTDSTDSSCGSSSDESKRKKQKKRCDIDFGSDSGSSTNEGSRGHLHAASNDVMVNPEDEDPDSPSYTPEPPTEEDNEIALNVGGSTPPMPATVMPQSESVPKAYVPSRQVTDGVNHMLTARRLPVEKRSSVDALKSRKVLMTGRPTQSLHPSPAEMSLPSIASIHNRERTMGPVARDGSSREHIEEFAATSFKMVRLHKQLDLLKGNFDTLKIESKSIQGMQEKYILDTRASLQSFLTRSLVRSEKDEVLNALEGSIQNTRKLYEYIKLLQSIVKDKSIHEVYQSSIIYDQQERFDNAAGILIHNRYRDSAGELSGGGKNSRTFFQFIDGDYKYSEGHIREIARSLPGYSEDEVRSSIKRAHDAMRKEKIKWPPAMAKFVDAYYGPDGHEVPEDVRGQSTETDADVEYFVTDCPDPEPMSTNRWLLIAKHTWISLQRYDSIMGLFTMLPRERLTVTDCRPLCNLLIELFESHDYTALLNLWREFQNPWAEFVTEDVLKPFLKHMAIRINKEERLKNPDKSVFDYTPVNNMVLTCFFKMISDKRAQGMGGKNCKRRYQPMVCANEKDKEATQLNCVIPVDDDIQNGENNFAQIIRESLLAGFVNDNQTMFDLLAGKQSDQKAMCAQGRRTKSDKVPEYLTVEQLADLATNENIRPIARQQPLRRSPRKHAAKKQQKSKKTPAKKAAAEAAEKPVHKKRSTTEKHKSTDESSSEEEASACKTSVAKARSNLTFKTGSGNTKSGKTQPLVHIDSNSEHGSSAENNPEQCPPGNRKRLKKVQGAKDIPTEYFDDDGNSDSGTPEDFAFPRSAAKRKPADDKEKGKKKEKNRNEMENRRRTRQIQNEQKEAFELMEENLRHAKIPEQYIAFYRGKMMNSDEENRFTLEDCVRHYKKVSLAKKKNE